MLSGFEDAIRHYDPRTTDAATQPLTRPWSRYGSVSLTPVDDQVTVLSVPETVFGQSRVDTPLTVSESSVQTRDGLAPIVGGRVVIPKFGIIVGVAGGKTGAFRLDGRLRPQALPTIPSGMTADLAYVTAEHAYADRFRTIVEKSVEWPLRQAAIIAALGLRIAHDRGDRPLDA